ncbi:Positive regulator of purine utilization [Colletotrichum tanaceti]|uniref:Positive regulator of purine utilization n=1 Tax=Colletotrichum tanaceti TaxID=1306861 RepID=A0A4U6WZG4_9PEZI|nr:Positive regulator of purine utilization [Colletotrichum tanaceti]TKW48490.1 Positive regulator of purine utilization [Colletotrichum tanaceti]
MFDASKTFRSISELQRRLERLENEGSPAPQAAVQSRSHSTAWGLDGSESIRDPDPPPPPVRTGVVSGVDPRDNHTGPMTIRRQAEDAPRNMLLSQLNGSQSRTDDETIYGLSSNISFLRQVTQVADPRKSASKSPDEPDDDDAEERAVTVLGFSATRPRTPDPSPEPLMLPERWLADSLIRSFMEFVHPVFPILHRPSFASSYEALWQPAARPRRHRDPRREFKDVLFNATLSIVLALGSQRTDRVSVAEQARLADKFYTQSVRLVSVDTLDHSSLQAVQLLLLRGVYLHYTQYADRCWNTVGEALRVAQGLGLHAQSDKAGAAAEENQLKREMRRRVWHCCLTLDRLTATTFGRPVLISCHYPVPTPATVDDEHLAETTEAEGVQPPDRPSYLVFFVRSLELFDVLNEILAKFYSDGDYASDRRAEYLNHVLQLSSRLDDLGASLPDYLREDADLSGFDEELRGCLQMQANIIKSRVLWIRLLLLRPLLLAEARKGNHRSRTRAAVGVPGPSSNNLGEGLGHAANTLCVATAHGVLRELCEKLGSARQNSPWHVLLCKLLTKTKTKTTTRTRLLVPWFIMPIHANACGCVVTFAAASTLIVATLCPDLGVDFDTEPTRTSWDRALRIFEFHKRHVSSAARGIEALQKFRESVAAVSRQEAPSGPAGVTTQDSISSEQNTSKEEEYEEEYEEEEEEEEERHEHETDDRLKEANHVAHPEQGGDLLMPFGSLQQLPGVVAADLAVVVDAADGLLDLLGPAVPPGGAGLNGLVGVVDGEQDAVGADLVDDVAERRRGEVARGRDPDVAAEVVVDGLLAHAAAAPVAVALGLGDGLLDVLEPVVDAPKVKGELLAQVADDDLEAREAVEDAVGDEAHEVQADAVGEGQRRADEVLALGVELVQDDVGGPRRVDVDGHVEVADDAPEGVVLGLVVELVRLAALAGVLEVAEQRAVEAELAHAARQLPARLRRVVHRQAGEGAEPVAVVLDLPVRPVVDLGGAPLRLHRIRDALDARHRERDDGVADAVRVREPDALVVDVADLAHVALAVARVDVEGGLALALGLLAGHLVGLLESDLSEHLDGFVWVEFFLSYMMMYQKSWAQGRIE